MPRKFTPKQRLENDRRPLRDSVRQYTDYDYFHKLLPEEQAWLNKFNQHYYLDYQASVHKLPVSKKETKAAQTKNSATRRSVNLTRRGETVAVPNQMSTPSPEDAYIEAIDGDFSERSHYKRPPKK